MQGFYIVFVLSALVASTFSAATDCNTDVTNCEETFKVAVNASGDDNLAACQAAKTFLACLDTKDNLPECASVKSVIANLRTSYATQISSRGCKNTGAPGSGPVQCTKDLIGCQQQFVVDGAKAGDNVTQACLAGEVLANCLNSVEARPECGGAKKVIDSIRANYHKEIDTQGCASIIRPAQTQCGKDVNACLQTFDRAVKEAPNNALEQCSAGAQLSSCLDNYDHKIECISAQSTIASLRATFGKQVADAGCGQEAKPTVTPCQGEVVGCLQTFVSANKIANGAEQECSAGAALTQCLDSKDKAPECASVKSYIASIRNNFASQIRTDGCAANPNDPKVQCSLNLINCQNVFLTQVQDAGNDVRSTCLAGANLETCIGTIENKPDCAPVKSKVDQLKNDYLQQIDQTACVSDAAEACAQGVTDCSTTYHTGITNETSATKRCTVANTYVSCLNKQTCSKSFKLQLTTARMMAQQMLNDTNTQCDLAKIQVGPSGNQGGDGGGASSLTVSMATVFMSLLMFLHAII